jgi:hypothetical protein
MLFETLKTNCAREAYDNKDKDFYGWCGVIAAEKILKTGKLNKAYSIPEALANTLYDAVMRTDIRQISDLSKYFPDVVPAWIKNNQYTPELTDNGWVLLKK